MITVGILPSKQLISLLQNEEGEWLDVPEGESVIPLVKIAKPEIQRTQKAEPVLQWFDDRVERQWQIIDLEGEELAEATRKKWENVQGFMAEFTMQEKAQIALSMEPTIAALRLELTTWLSEVHSDDPRVVMGLSKLVELGIISEQRKTEITSTP